jgi:integrase
MMRWVAEMGEIRRYQEAMDDRGDPSTSVRSLLLSCSHKAYLRRLSLRCSEMLGHASVAFMLTVYAHVLPYMQKNAATTMERLLGDGSW